MKNSLIFFLAIFLLTSCETNQEAYSYLCDADASGEIVELTYDNIDNSSPFKYTIQSREMCIQWGYSTNPSDYIFMGNTDSIVAIKPIVHNFPSSGEYGVKIKSLELKGLDLSKVDSNEIKSLKLTKCDKLQRLFCKNQPITELDLSGCPLLIELVCGYTGGTQTLSDITKLSELRFLSINGATNIVDFNFSANDSLQTVSFSQANLTQLHLDSLKILASVVIDGCSSFQYLSLSNNNNLVELSLTNNTSLDSDALNEIFRELPQAKNANCTITLGGNKGDNSCDRSIALDKGWTFKDDI